MKLNCQVPNCRAIEQLKQRHAKNKKNQQSPKSGTRVLEACENPIKVILAIFWNAKSASCSFIGVPMVRHSYLSKSLSTGGSSGTTKTL